MQLLLKLHHLFAIVQSQTVSPVSLTTGILIGSGLVLILCFFVLGVILYKRHQAQLLKRRIKELERLWKIKGSREKH